MISMTPDAIRSRRRRANQSKREHDIERAEKRDAYWSLPEAEREAKRARKRRENMTPEKLEAERLRSRLKARNRTHADRQAERMRAAEREGREYRTHDQIRIDTEKRIRQEEKERIKRKKERDRLRPIRLAKRKQRQHEYNMARRFTLKVQVNRQVQRAVASGELFKPNHCEHCGLHFDQRALHGHHEDYSRPFDVQWLCTKCHVKAHDGTWGMRTK